MTLRRALFLWGWTGELCPDADKFDEVSDSACRVSDTSGGLSDTYGDLSDTARDLSDMARADERWPASRVVERQSHKKGFMRSCNFIKTAFFENCRGMVVEWVRPEMAYLRSCEHRTPYIIFH